jgi:hypothetical protein
MVIGPRGPPFSYKLFQSLLPLGAKMQTFIGLDTTYIDIRNYFLGKDVSAPAQEVGHSLIATLDDPTEGVPEIDYNKGEVEKVIEGKKVTEPMPLNPGGPVPVGTVRKRCSFITNIATECKIEIEGITIDNAANRLVAHRWIKRRMEKHGMRVRHIQQTLPLAVEAVFIPDRFEIEAREVRQSKAVLDRYAEYDKHIQPRQDSRVWNPFGFRKARSYPAPG